MRGFASVHSSPKFFESHSLVNLVGPLYSIRVVESLVNVADRVTSQAFLYLIDYASAYICQQYSSIILFCMFFMLFGSPDFF